MAFNLARNDGMRFMSISLTETDLRPLLLCNEFDINNIVMVHNDDAKW